MFSWVEHENFFITLGPGCYLSTAVIQQKSSLIITANHTVSITANRTVSITTNRTDIFQQILRRSFNIRKTFFKQKRGRPYCRIHLNAPTNIKGPAGYRQANNQIVAITVTDRFTENFHNEYVNVKGSDVQVDQRLCSLHQCCRPFSHIIAPFLKQYFKLVKI